VTQDKALQYFTLAVPTEKDNATTSKIQLTVPSGFAIDSFENAPGWKRDVQQTGSGDAAVVQKVTWTGGSTPSEEDSVFHFLASPDSAKTFDLKVEQTYSDGSVVDWTGSESSDTPVPTVRAVKDLGGGSSGGGGAVAYAAAIAALVALILALVAVGSRSGAGGDKGGRSLT
jgi:uncharacterized protein YcnI